RTTPLSSGGGCKSYEPRKTAMLPPSAEADGSVCFISLNSTPDPFPTLLSSSPKNTHLCARGLAPTACCTLKRLPLHSLGQLKHTAGLYARMHEGWSGGREARHHRWSRLLRAATSKQKGDDNQQEQCCPNCDENPHPRKLGQLVGHDSDLAHFRGVRYWKSRR